MKLWIVISLCLGLGGGLTSCLDTPQRPAAAPTPTSAPSSSGAEPEPAQPLLDPSLRPTESWPQVDAAGNYRRTNHRHWTVVDPDPAGLNCRWSSEIPEEWYSPAASYPRMNISEWPVVQQFPVNTELLANIAPAGFAMLYDENHRPWLKVSLGDQEDICLVRAHTGYIKPIAP